MNDADRLREIFGPTDPVADDGYVPDLDRRERTLRAILASTPAPAPPRRAFAGRSAAAQPRRVLAGRAVAAPPRRAFAGWAVAAAAVAVIGVVVAVALPQTASSAWATPAPLTGTTVAPQPGAPRLLALAATLAGQPPAAAPIHDHLLIRSWSLNSDIAGTTVTCVVIPTETEVRRAPDNSGSRTVAYLPPESPTKAQLDEWHDEGSPGADQTRTTEEYAAGQFVAVWPDRPPTDPGRLRAWLSATRQGTDPATTVVGGITDLLQERTLTAAERAATLTLLAGLPGLRYTGTLTDRAGRTGDAYTVVVDGSGLPVTHTFVVDPGGGRILAQERVLATEVGRLDITAPAVIGYDTYL
ncbi:CU044_5270 family protein [Asanoa sp. NPDC049518]|uniref:CU044_5270 family protein n=1 Tax=unclassified Asanoa TaxID=2685164 RepID=UPI003437535B